MLHKKQSTSQSLTSAVIQAIWVILFSLLIQLIFPRQLGAQDTIMLFPTSGAVGTHVTLSGKGLSFRFVAIYWDDQILDPKVPIKNNGELDYRFKVPPSARGKHVVAIRELGASSNTNIASAVFTVTPYVEIFPDSGRARTPITITGWGFTPFEKDIKIFWNGTILLSSVQANQFGSWGVTVEAPDAAKGEYFISVSGTATTAHEIGTLKFIVVPFAKIVPSSGPVGTEVEIHGFGFRTGEDGITITYDNEIIKCNIVGGPDGTWDTTITIPPSTAGYHTIGVYGSSFTPKGIVPDIQFKVIPKIELQPDSGGKGDKITTKGTGFASNEKVSIHFGSIALDTVYADDLGCFEFVFQVPQSQKGEHNITASGSSGNVAKANFIIERTPPLPPKLLSPKNGERLEIFSSIGKLLSSTSTFLLHAITPWWESPNQNSVTPGINLSWTGTAGDEDVTYTIQISRGWEGDFTTPILVKEHLTETSYKCNLPQGYYTWRVKAVDDIGNESPWSESSQFQMVLFSPLIFAALIAIPLSVAGTAIWVWLSITRA